jgi:eukaryotic-like serine/threonine-protein kinase
MRPKVIGPYIVHELLGSGGVGTVYRAVDSRTTEDVALKLLTGAPSMDARAARRLVREFETLFKLSHPNVVKVFDTGVHFGSPYLAMELIDGLTLREHLSLSGGMQVPAGRPLSHVEDSSSHSFARGVSEEDWEEDSEESSEGARPFDLSAFYEEAPSEEEGSLSSSSVSVRVEVGRARAGPASGDTGRAAGNSAPSLEELNRPERLGRLKDAMLQVCQALAYIHGHGLVHRDLKPSNIMVDEDRLVRLMDFGLAKFLADDAGVTGDGRMVGTFRYMAPEQILGEPLDGRADLYSLGVILYELLSGRAPFDARTPYELWQKVLETEPPPLLSINAKGDPQLAWVAHRLMRKEPDDRFQTVEEVYEALSE